MIQLDHLSFPSATIYSHMKGHSSLRVLFWNACRSSDLSLICDLVNANNVDILALAEMEESPASVLKSLKVGVDSRFVAPSSLNPRVQVFGRTKRLGLEELHNGGRITIRQLVYEGTQFLFVAAHLMSLTAWNTSDQSAEAQVLADQIRSIEDKRGHRRTILIGDLNMNPFDNGAVMAAGLHGTMTKDIAAKSTRTVQSVDYPFFYNPMWGLFGDRTAGPAGTYYYRHSGHVSYDWNMFDQVMIRPEVLDWFADDVKIVTTLTGREIADRNGRPNKSQFSDHFPILLTLEPK